MKTYTVHTRDGGGLVLVPEAFSWGAAIFGPFWLFAHRAWIAGVLALCAAVAAGVLPRPGLSTLAGLALAWVLGLWGQDLRRWSLARRGFMLRHVVSGRNRDGALQRLLDVQPAMATEAMR